MAVKDEFRLHLFYISKLITKYSKILVFAPDGETGIFDVLQEKFPDVNFYYQTGGEVEEPFVFSIMSLDNPNIPDCDIIYCIQYTTEYKEMKTGYKFPVGQEWMPLVEYSRMAAWQKLAGKNLSGKIMKSLAELRKLME